MGAPRGRVTRQVLLHGHRPPTMPAAGCGYGLAARGDSSRQGHGQDPERGCPRGPLKTVGAVPAWGCPESPKGCGGLGRWGACCEARGQSAGDRGTGSAPSVPHPPDPRRPSCSHERLPHRYHPVEGLEVHSPPEEPFHRSPPPGPRSWRPFLACPINTCPLTECALWGCSSWWPQGARAAGGREVGTLTSTQWGEAARGSPGCQDDGTGCREATGPDSVATSWGQTPWPRRGARLRGHVVGSGASLTGAEAASRHNLGRSLASKRTQLRDPFWPHACVSVK